MDDITNICNTTWESITALGTIFAVVVALMLPFLQQLLMNCSLKKKIKQNMALELFMNYKGVLLSKDFAIDKEQYNTFRANMDLFPTKQIEYITLKFKRFYELFDKYSKEFGKQAISQQQEAQFARYQIQILMLDFLGIISTSDETSVIILAKILYNIDNLKPFDDIIQEYSEFPFMKFLLKKTSLKARINEYGDYFCDTEFKQLVSIAFDYLAKKYDTENLKIHELLAKRISALI